MLYGASVWFLPEETEGEKTRRREMVAAIKALQKAALCVVTGAFRTTAAAVL